MMGRHVDPGLEVLPAIAAAMSLGRSAASRRSSICEHESNEHELTLLLAQLVQRNGRDFTVRLVQRPATSGRARRARGGRQPRGIRAGREPGRAARRPLARQFPRLPEREETRRRDGGDPPHPHPFRPIPPFPPSPPSSLPACPVSFPGPAGRAVAAVEAPSAVGRQRGTRGRAARRGARRSVRR
jgi:hypothetical protein